MRSLLVVFLLVSTSLAGCLGGTDEAPADDGTDIQSTVGGKNNETFVNPDGSQSAAAVETNKTVVGKGGIEHLHDYWGGEQSKVIFDGPIRLRGPVFCDEKDTGKTGCYILRLPVETPAVLVFEGTAKLTFEVSDVAQWVQGIEMRYRNGANPMWSDATPVSPSSPFEMPVSAIETDMPHASASQWAWKLIGTRAVGPSTTFLSLWDTQAKSPLAENVPADFNVKITVHKGDKIVDWPGHPDFYADKPSRVVMEKVGATKNTGVQDQWLYGDEANVIRPDLLISSGTGNLTFHLNVSSSKLNGLDMVPDVYYIDYTNATGYWSGGYTQWNAFVNRLVGEKVSDTYYVFRCPVHYTGWDSPYAPSSGWQFIVRPGYSVPNPATGGRILLNPSSLAYDVEFQLTVIATPDPQYVGSDALDA